MSRMTEKSVAIARDLAADELDSDDLAVDNMPELESTYDTTKFFEFQDPSVIEAQNRRDLVDGYNPIDGTRLTRSQHNVLLDQLSPSLTSDERRTVADDRMIADDLDMFEHDDIVESAWGKLTPPEKRLD